jgi:hypothetical protein
LVMLSTIAGGCLLLDWNFQGTGTSGGGGSDAGTSSGTGGSCTCDAGGNPCITSFKCVAGTCMPTYADAGQALPQNSGYEAGDCHVGVCDEDGGINNLVNDDNIPDSGNPCIKFTCSNGQPDAAPACDVGDTCKSNTDCVKSNCVDGYCCDNPCNGQCRACGLSMSKGQCAPAPAGYDDSRGTNMCTGMYACSAGGSCVGKAGTTCDPNNSGFDCLSGLCSLGKDPMCMPSPLNSPCTTTEDCAAGTCQNYICS